MKYRKTHYPCGCIAKGLLIVHYCAAAAAIHEQATRAQLPRQARAAVALLNAHIAQQ